MFASTAEREIAQEIKERLCFVANDFELEMMAATASIAVERSFDLQDGQKVVIGKHVIGLPKKEISCTSFYFDRQRKI